MSAIRTLFNPLALVLIAWVVWYFWIYRDKGARVAEAVRVQIEECSRSLRKRA